MRKIMCLTCKVFANFFYSNLQEISVGCEVKKHVGKSHLGGGGGGSAPYYKRASASGCEDVIGILIGRYYSSNIF